MKHEDMKLAEFSEWLRTRPSDFQYFDGRPSVTCPIAKFCGHPSASTIPRMPDWARFFINRFDGAKDATQLTALQVLAETEERFRASLG